MYLLDTNIIIYLIRKKDFKLFDQFKKESPESVFISTITVAELEFGISKSNRILKNRMALKQFLSVSNILIFDRESAEEYGVIRANLEKKGTPIGPLDTLIAAHAKSLNLTLVTNNEKEFRRVEGLKVENWVF